MQMVMMHELAHCVQMNHGGAFWKVRNQFAGELKALWGKGYTGDGFWGRGKTLLSGQYEPAVGLEPEIVPRSLCGGTFRSTRRRKRKRAAGEWKALTYAERQQRRIVKKFGKNGVTLGNDEDTKVKLEDGKRPKGKPRVAQSARGRELRAAAALARFGQQHDEVVKKEEETGSESEPESEYEDSSIKLEAVDINGSRLLDSKGNTMVKVCEDEDRDDIHVKEEMQELQDINALPPEPKLSLETIKVKDEKDKKKEDEANIFPSSKSYPFPGTVTPPPTDPKQSHQPKSTKPPFALQTTTSSSAQLASNPIATCPICSLSNPPSTPRCTACSHVLLLQALPGLHWRCKSSTCRASGYINAADCGVCGVCGARKDVSSG